jgi:hypothetical protein
LNREGRPFQNREVLEGELKGSALNWIDYILEVPSGEQEVIEQNFERQRCYNVIRYPDQSPSFGVALLSDRSCCKNTANKARIWLKTFLYNDHLSVIDINVF